MVKALPNNIEVEQYVIGSLMINKQNEVYKLTEDDFSIESLRIIFRAIHKLFIDKKEIDFMTVTDLVADDIQDASNRLIKLTTMIDTTARFDSAFKILKKYSLKRQIIEKAQLLYDLVENETEGVLELKNEAMAIMDLNAYEEDKTDSMFDVTRKVEADIKKRIQAKDENKLFTGFYDLDGIMAGFHPEELTIIAARPAVGKTAFALQLMLNLAGKDNHCYFVSREMSTLQLGKRLLSNQSEVNGNKLRLCKGLTQDELDRIKEANKTLSYYPLVLDDKTGTVQAIRSKCRELHNSNKLDILIIDYLQLLKSSGKHSSRREEIESISRSLKEISMEFNIPVIALSQLSRASTDNNEPQLHHLRESGSLEQDADNVIFLHKPEDATETLKLIIAKQRNGNTGFIHLVNEKDTLKFKNATRRE